MVSIFSSKVKGWDLATLVKIQFETDISKISRTAAFHRVFSKITQDDCYRLKPPSFAI